MAALLRRFGHSLILTAIGAACPAVLVAAAPAQARAFVGFGVGVAPPAYYPPAYYPPPYYAPPPPVVYAPPPAVAYVPSARSRCAGPVICAMTVPIRPGGTCWCTDIAGGRVYGTAS